MSNPVAVAADVSATPSTSTGGPEFGATAGVWKTEGMLAVTTGAKLTVNGAPVALDASQKFSWTGTVSNSPAGPFYSTVQLPAGETKVKVNGQSVLVDGDSKNDPPPYSDKVSVSASGKLQTA